MQEKNIKYPLRFYPVLKQTLWGGDKIVPFLSLEGKLDKNGTPYSKLEHVGEFWAVSAIEGQESVVSEGALKGYSLPQLVAEYGRELVGKRIFELYGRNFPLLFKFIDAAQDLSVQVHPNDELAAKRHNCSGKTEMWYVLDAGNESRLLSGFARPITAVEYKNMSADEIVNALQNYNIKSGDMFYLPAGTIHSIGRGAFIAEIQQSSDITYRIYDYNRRDKDGNFRELHTNLAADAIDFNNRQSCKIDFTPAVSESDNAWESATTVVKSEHFSTNIIQLQTVDEHKDFQFDYAHLDSFVILTCMKGSCSLLYNSNNEADEQSVIGLEQGCVILLPACLKSVVLRVTHSASCELMEIHI